MFTKDDAPQKQTLYHEAKRKSDLELKLIKCFCKAFSLQDAETITTYIGNKKRGDILEMLTAYDLFQKIMPKKDAREVICCIEELWKEGKSKSLN